MKKYFNNALLFTMVLLMIPSCKDDVLGPNDLGGNTNLELTQVGGDFDTYFSAEPYNPIFNNLKDSVVITRNNNGIVTFHAQIKFDSNFVRGLDTALGISALPYSAKLALVDTYTKRFGAILDTTNKKDMKLVVDIKTKITSEGIQEFITSKGDESKPFTIVKYAANIGDKYEFTNSEGVKITREVKYKSTTDDYPIVFWLIKVTKVEETQGDTFAQKITQEDVFVQKMTYITNHKFGLVGVVVETKNGKIFKLGIVPPNM